MIVSLADMKAILGISSGDTSHDAFLTGQLTLISYTVEEYCRRKFEQTSYSETFYGDEHPRSKQLKTFMYPLISVTSITEDANAALDNTTYRINKSSGFILRPDGFFNWGVTKTVVVYSAGYVAGSIPLRLSVRSCPWFKSDTTKTNPEWT